MLQIHQQVTRVRQGDEFAPNHVGLLDRPRIGGAVRITFRLDAAASIESTRCVTTESGPECTLNVMTSPTATDVGAGRSSTASPGLSAGSIDPVWTMYMR